MSLITQYLAIFFDHIIFLGGGVAFLIAIMNAVKKDKRFVNKILSMLYLILAAILIHDYFIDNKLCEFCSPSGIIADNQLPFLLLWIDQFFRMVIFLAGPFFFFYIKALLMRSDTLKKPELLHFIPFILTMAYCSFIIVWFGLHNPEIPDIQSEIFKIFETAGRIHLILYFLYVLYYVKFFDVLRYRESRKIRNTALYITLLFFVVLLVPSIAQIFLDMKTHIILNVSISLIIILLPVMEKRHPDVSEWMGFTINKIRYEKSLIKGINTEALKSRLVYLMEVEKLYRDDCLTLKSLADELSLTPHQLSEFLNKELSSNFNSYINAFRINEAKKILSSEPDFSVLRIAYDVGFNAKSSFYRFFKKETGMSPLDYRKKVRRD